MERSRLCAAAAIFKGRLGARHAHARPFGVRPLSFGSWGEIATATRVLSLCHAATRNRLFTTIARMRCVGGGFQRFITCAHYDPESDVLLALLVAPFDSFLHRRLLLLLDPNPPESRNTRTCPFSKRPLAAKNGSNGILHTAGVLKTQANPCHSMQARYGLRECQWQFVHVTSPFPTYVCTVKNGTRVRTYVRALSGNCHQ